jgi:hypothetical protein
VSFWREKGGGRYYGILQRVFLEMRRGGKVRRKGLEKMIRS